MTPHISRATAARDAAAPATASRARGSRSAPFGALALSAALFGLIGGATVHAEDAPTVPTSSGDPAAPDTGAAAPAAPVAIPATSTGQFTLPLFGTGLTIDVTTGAAGTLSSVAVVTDPAGLVATEVRPREVEIVTEDGTAKVVVRSNKGGQRVEARAGSLAEIVGPGGWSGEVFPGVVGSVAFEITGAEGVLGISPGAVEGPGAEVGAVEVSSDGDEQEAKLRIIFRQDGMKRTLTIKASVDSGDGDSGDSGDSGDEDSDGDGGTTAKVRISLSKISSLPFVGIEPGVATTWTGTLCNGAAASITYTVNENGTLSLGALEPAAEQKVAGNSIEVKYATGEKVKIKLRDAGGALAVKVDESLRCKNAAAPSVNVPVKDGSHDKDKHGKNEHDKDKDKDKDEHGKDEHDKGTGDTTTPDTTQPATTTPPPDTTQPAADAGEQSDDD